MMNEAHNGLRRCIRTREVGMRLVPTAHALEVRDLAMEALWDRGFTAGANRAHQLPPAQHPDSYLAQPEMRAFIQAALDLRWTLHSYEADHSRAPAGLVTSVQQGESLSKIPMEGVNWRETEQARNLAAVLDSLGDGARLLVWCGNGHGIKRAAPHLGGWTPMGYEFRILTGIDQFSIDQTASVDWDNGRARSLDTATTVILESLGGTAGYLTADARHDATLYSLHNRLE
jgi:hypothetical protein